MKEPAGALACGLCYAEHTKAASDAGSVNLPDVPRPLIDRTAQPKKIRAFNNARVAAKSMLRQLTRSQ